MPAERPLFSTVVAVHEPGTFGAGFRYCRRAIGVFLPVALLAVAVAAALKAGDWVMTALSAAYLSLPLWLTPLLWRRSAAWSAGEKVRAAAGIVVATVVFVPLAWILTFLVLGFIWSVGWTAP